MLMQGLVQQEGGRVPHVEGVSNAEHRDRRRDVGRLGPELPKPAAFVAARPKSPSPDSTETPED
jgi:hypothetical protein